MTSNTIINHLTPERMSYSGAGE